MKRVCVFLLTIVLLLNLAGCQKADVHMTTEHSVPTGETFATETTPAVSPEHTPTEEDTTPTDTEITELPISQDPIVSTEPENADFVRVIDYIPTTKQVLAYASVNNFTGYRIYDFTDAYLRYGTVKKLMQVCGELEQKGIGLIIWDAFRPVSAQAKLWEICPDPTFVSNPVTGKRTHCRGNTVDVALYDLDSGEALSLPTGFDNFTSYADRDYSDCSPNAATNAQLLEDVMVKYGFTPYFAEWWHFSDSTDYPVDEYFDPAIPTVWVANCNEYISLWETPDGEVIAKIPKGETVELKSWQGKYAEVTYCGQTGFVRASYIMPVDSNYFSDCLDTVAHTNVYSYEQMLSDMATLEARHPDAVSVASIGTSELGREIPVIRIGNIDARYHVLLQGAIHGREHLTAWLLMAMADFWLDHDILGYEDVCYHIIPMTNPDGVIISQTGMLTETQRQIYLSDKEKGYTSRSENSYATLWKANGEGIDINRNFSAGWENINDRTVPSSQQYKGDAPFSCAEAVALRDYTLQYAFDATISYHETGSLIYYEYGDNELANSESKSLAKAAREISGYVLTSSNGVVGAGYKDWAIEELGIPSLTIEIGCESAPLAEREIYSVFVRNYRILPALARWLQM